MNRTPRALIIDGGKHLIGNVTLSGYKHSAVLIANAALLCKGVSKISNFPLIRDIQVLLQAADALGCSVRLRKEEAVIDSRNSELDASLDDLAGIVHGSLYLIPVLLARSGRVKLFKPGGCRIGRRPTRHVVSVLETMGARRARIKKQEWLEAPQGLRGSTFDLREINPTEHSGRTKTALLAGVLAQGTTKILAPFQAQEIDDLCSFLILSGAQIKRGEEVITVEGQSELYGCTFAIPADFLEFATLSCAVQSAGGSVCIEPLPPMRFFAKEFDLLAACGVLIKKRENSILVESGNAHPVQFACPPIYSDLQPIITATLWKADGISTVRDEVWPNRFDHIEGLRRLGATVDRTGNSIYVCGPSTLHGTNLEANDLRSAAAQLVAALGASGTSFLTGVEHLARGYYNLSNKLCALGASIEEEMK